MEMQGERRIPAPRQIGLGTAQRPRNAEAVHPRLRERRQGLRHRIHRQGRAKVGPVKARFTGKVTLTDLDPPAGYTISGEGTGGVAGFAKGSAKVALDEDGGETVCATASRRRSAASWRRSARA